MKQDAKTGVRSRTGNFRNPGPTPLDDQPVGAKPKPVAAELHRVAGRHNSRLKELRQSFRRGELTANDECAIEGVKLIDEALRSGQRVTGIFFSESGRPLADKLLPQISSRVEPLLLPDSLFKSIVPSDSPQGIAALVKVRTWTAEQLLDRAELGIFVVAAGIQDPGNLGTLLRSAEAFGTAGIFLLEGTVSLFNPKVLRGSAGSAFRIPVLHMGSKELIPELKQRRVRLIATTSHKGTPLPAVNWNLPLAIFIGNEGAGLPRDLMHHMDETVVIPQAAQVESLNAGVAASIVMYEAARQRK